MAERLNLEVCRPQRMDQVIWKVIDGKGILLNLEDGAYFEVDPVGLMIWQQFDGRRSLAEITHSVAQEFQTSPTRVADDLAAFTAELKRKKLIAVAKTPRQSACVN